MLTDRDVAGSKRRAQDVDDLLGLYSATNDHIERRIPRVRPAVEGNMAPLQNGNTGHATFRRMLMNMNMEELCPCHRDTHAKCVLNVRQIVKPARASDIDDQVHSRETQTILFGRSIQLDVLPGKRRSKIFRLGGA